MATCAGLLQFTATAFPTICSSSGETDIEARQVCQGDAKTPFAKDNEATYGAMAEHSATAAMTDRGEENASHYLTVERRIIGLGPYAS